MRPIKLFLFAFLAMLIYGCQDTDIVDSPAEFKEYIVIRSELKANTMFQGVQITRTLHFNEAYSIDKAEIQNADVYLKVNGYQVIPLHYTTEGIYKSIYDVYISSEYVYELFGKVGGKSIYAETRVPGVPEVQDASYQSDLYLTANVLSKPNEVYGAVWAIVRNPSNPPEVSDNFFSIVPLVYNVDEVSVSLRSGEIPENLRTFVLRSSTYIRVTAFDEPYLEYFKTKNNDQPVDNVFLSGTGPVAWNVRGENVIGMFIGSAEGSLISP